MNDNTLQLFDKSMDEYIAYFLLNCSYIQNKQIQDSRSNLKIIDVKPEDIQDKRFLKHKCFVDRYDSVYITLTYDYLTCGERINFKNIRQLRYELLDMDTINKLFGNTIDVFHNGIKIPRSELMIALYDNYFVVQLPAKYKTFITMNVLMRPYVYDASSNKKVITIKKEDIKDSNKDEIIVYANGKQIRESYSVIEDDTTITITLTVPTVTLFEVVFVRNLKKHGYTSFKNSHIRLLDKRGKFPISVNNILTFNDGYFVNYKLQPKTANYFYSEIPAAESDVFYTLFVYKEEEYDHNYYDDNYAWFTEFKDNIMDIINSPEQLPEFVNQFYLFNREISLSDYLENKYTNLLDYNIDMAKQTLLYNDELICKVYECIFKNISYISVERKFLYMKDYDLANYLRYNNKAENTDPNKQVDFISGMYLFQIPNINKYNINIYIDGIRYFDFRYDDYVADIQNIYLKSSRIKKSSVIEFEYIKTPYTDVRKVNILGSNTNILSISNAKEVGLINSIIEEKYIEVFNNNNSIYTNIPLTNVTYDAVEDVLHIESSTKFKEGSMYTVSNNNFCKIFKFDTRRRGEGFTAELEGLFATTITKNSFRVYKNGRELSSDVITNVTWGGTAVDGITTITLDIRYTIYELIEIEYIPEITETVFSKKLLASDGKVDLYNNTFGKIGKNFITECNQYYILNGRRVLPENYKRWCAKGMTLSGLKSQKNFAIKHFNNKLLEEMMTQFYNFYETSCNKLFSKYVVGIMEGSLTDTEDDCTDVNIERTGELYYDLYQEFLKHNIIDTGDNLPEYIAFKYKGLIDEGLNNTIMIDNNEDQLYWMPLDASMTSDESLLNILGLYYKLLQDVHSVQVVNPTDIPEELYEKYKELFNNNVLVLQVPNFSLKQ